jgi:hypothetical protein
VHRAVRLSSLPWRKLCRSFLLPLLLLLAQQGAVLHELSHYPATEVGGDSKSQTSHGDICGLCLAFAQVDSAAAPDVSVPLLLAELSFELAPVAPVHVGATQLPAQRSRGPPSVL